MHVIGIGLVAHDRRKEDLLAAKADPDSWRGLTVRVAGYTAYFTELANDLQDEIIARTSHGDV